MTEDIEELRKEKLQEMQEEDERDEQREQIIQAAKQYLTDEAQSRLENIRVARPEQASMVESQIAKLGMTNRIQGEITDEELKKMLKDLNQSGSDYNIKHR